eukprot:TRINITY_DN9815_c0_g1_i1.p1 TRINITY_DN9815_c0_g1~~TRINITY_DN9815_c0_g1_i1.p1  ORF type:complete len:542 (+),score=42.76 TRINITY_DN9815_c0_g1_i1:101-1726(+)
MPQSNSKRKTTVYQRPWRESQSPAEAKPLLRPTHEQLTHAVQDYFETDVRSHTQGLVRMAKFIHDSPENRSVICFKLGQPGVKLLFDDLKYVDRIIRKQAARVICDLAYHSEHNCKILCAENGFTFGPLRIFCVPEKFKVVFDHFVKTTGLAGATLNDLTFFLKHIVHFNFHTEERDKRYWCFPAFDGPPSDFPDPKEYLIGFYTYPVTPFKVGQRQALAPTSKDAPQWMPLLRKWLNENVELFDPTPSNTPMRVTSVAEGSPMGAPGFNRGLIDISDSAVQPFSTPSFSTDPPRAALRQRPKSAHVSLHVEINDDAQLSTSMQTPSPTQKKKKSLISRALIQQLEKSWQSMSDFNIDNTINMQLSPAASHYRFRSAAARKRIYEMMSQSVDFDTLRSIKLDNMLHALPTKSSVSHSVVSAPPAYQPSPLKPYMSSISLLTDMAASDFAPARLSHVNTYISPQKASAAAQAASIDKSSGELLLEFQGLLVSPRESGDPQQRLVPPPIVRAEEVKEVPFVFAAGRLSPPPSRLSMTHKARVR